MPGLAGAEAHPVPLADQDMAARQGRMAAKGDLDRRREPAQLVIRLAVGGRDGEGGLGEVVLHRDRLEDLVRQPFLQRNDGRRIAGERPVGEGVDLDEAQFRHRVVPPDRW